MTRAAIQRPVSTLVFALGLAVFGFWNLLHMPVDFLPDVTYPLIKLSIEWPGATPDDIDRGLADPIERQLASVDGLDFLSSSSMEGLYQLDVNFRYGVDADTAYQDTLAAFARAGRDLPDDSEPAVIIKADPSQLPIVQVVFESDRMDLRDLRLWIDNWLVERLLAAPGVAAVDVAGGLKREIRIFIDPAKLEKHGLQLEDIERRLREENVDRLGGRITGPHQEAILRTLGEFTDLDQIRSITVATSGADRLLLGDVARVEDSHEEVRLLTRLNGNPAVKANIIKSADANTVEAVREVVRRLENLRSAFPPGVSFTLVENQAEYILGSIRGVSTTAIEAAVLVVIGFFIFLGNPRLVLIVLITLPVTVLANFFVMREAGFSLNILSLGGLIVAISVLLDPSTIVLENIERHRLNHPERDPASVAEQGTREVGGAVVAAGMAFVALFLPFLLVQGMMPLLFRELVLIILSIVILSSLGAITLAPTLASLLMRKPRNPRIQTRSVPLARRLDAAMQNIYGPVVKFCLYHRRLVLLGFLVMLAGGGMAFQKAGSEFFPSVDDGRIMVKVRMPAGVPLERLDGINQQIEALVEGDPRVRTVFALSGGAVRGLYTNKIGNEGEVNIELVPVGDRDVTTDEYIRELRPKVAALLAPSARLMVAQSKMRGIRTLGASDLEIEINGSDTAELFSLANDVAARLRERPELTNVYVSLDYTKPEFQAIIDRDRAADLGFTVRQIAGALRGYVGGNVPTLFRDGNDLYDLRVLIPETKLRSRSDVEDLPVPLAGGGYARLRDVAKVTSATGPVEILRMNQVKQVVVRSDAREVSLGEAEAAVDNALAGFPWPTGYDVSMGGKAKQMAEMQSTVKAILGLALLFSFIVLAVQFNSLRLPLVVLLAAPFCLAGIGYGLLLGGQPFGVTVVIALLVVLAANVNDAVLLIETAERHRASGLPLLDAVHSAALLRLRPRLMTTLPIVLGFLPLALAFEAGTELLQPMATAAIGGLLTEVFVALLLVPVFYFWISPKSLPVTPQPKLPPPSSSGNNQPKKTQ
jgi:hydrophobic/amphiphilic exporter-1 (mainly G- bacteria), HAE1 family